MNSSMWRDEARISIPNLIMLEQNEALMREVSFSNVEKVVMERPENKSLGPYDSPLVSFRHVGPSSVLKCMHWLNSLIIIRRYGMVSIPPSLL